MNRYTKYMKTVSIPKLMFCNLVVTLLPKRDLKGCFV